MDEEIKDTETESESSDASEAAGSGRAGRWSEVMKELTLTGLATVFMTEDSVRNYLKDKKLPKELANLVLESIGKKKDDFYGLLAKEFGRVLSRVDISKEVSRFLEQHSVHLEAKVSFTKKDGEKIEESKDAKESKES
jgi:hypothetical protein